MKMAGGDGSSLWRALTEAGEPAGRFLDGAKARVQLSALSSGSSLGGALEGLRGRSILLATESELAAALAMIELDGVARRMVLCPPGVPEAHLAAIAKTAAVEAVVSDHPQRALPARTVHCSAKLAPASHARRASHATEWVMLTSGTTGVPKLVVHDLATLAGPAGGGKPLVWSTFYDIRRYGGLQMLLRALVGGGSMVLPGAGETTADFLARVSASAVTHISGTPTHWRRALMSPAAQKFRPSYVRLSGEIADQAILDRLDAFFPGAALVHAFASTEAGLAFEVNDRRAGFPANFLGTRENGVEMRVVEGSLRIRSPRNAKRYLGGGAVAGPDGFVDTGDMVELRGDRYFFAGRRDGIINVGGQKVHPEEVEAVISTHPAVEIALVTARKNPITGALVVADVVLKDPRAGEIAKDEIMTICRRALPPHKVPASIRVVAALGVAASGKLERGDE